MRKDVFWKLSSHLRDVGLLRDTIHVSVEEQLAMFLHTHSRTQLEKLCDWILFQEIW